MLRLICLIVLLIASPAAAERLHLVATIAQLGEPLAVIADGRARVSSLLGPGVDPHLYRPTRTDILQLSRADMIVWTGQNLESKMAGAIERLSETRPALAVIRAVDPDLLIDDPALGRDPHLWMDPTLWQAALAAAVERLAEADPANAHGYRASAADYFAELEALTGYVREVLATIPERRRVLITAHDAFNYFGRRFDLEVRGVQGQSTESEASLKDIERLVALIVERQVPAVFAETSVSNRNVRALIEGAAARGHRVVLGGRLYSDAMGRAGSYAGTYIGMIDHNASTIAAALGGQVPKGGFRAWRADRAARDAQGG